MTTDFLAENSILRKEIFENTLNEELNKLLMVEIQSREKLYSTEYNMEIQNMERRDSELQITGCLRLFFRLESRMCLDLPAYSVCFGVNFLEHKWPLHAQSHDELYNSVYIQSIHISKPSI